MNSSKVPIFNRTTQKSFQWLREILEGSSDMTEQTAYSLLRATLHALRDRLPIDEAAHFSAQLPLLLKGTFYENWDPLQHPSREKTVNDFIEKIKADLGPTSHLVKAPHLEDAIRAVCQVIKKHVSDGEVASIVHSLPEEIALLLK